MEEETEKKKSVIEEIILSDSDDDNCQNVNEVNGNKSLKNINFDKNPSTRGILPLENKETFSWVKNNNVVRRCCIEHCYFTKNPLSQNSCFPRNPSTSICTVQFQNKNEGEQQTIDSKCLASNSVDCVSISDSLNQNKIENKEKVNSVRRSSCNSSSSSDPEVTVNNFIDPDYCPQKNASDSEDGSVGSNESCDSANETLENSNKEISQLSLIKQKAECLKNANISYQTGINNRIARRKTYPSINKIPNNFVSVQDLVGKIKSMQQVVKTDLDMDFTNTQKTAKIPPPKLKKMYNRGKIKDFSKPSEYSLCNPNLSKPTSGDKNWKVEYMNNDVQNLGLDDLLLKASELNAENFTKALGRNDLVKPNFNKKDNSELVFTIPKSKGNTMDQNCKLTENDFSKISNTNTIKLDISKSPLHVDKTKEQRPAQESSKVAEEISPKKLGLKVKTVENINEEFKDSLELKNKNFQECHIDGAEKNVTPILDKKPISCNSMTVAEEKVEESLKDTDNEQTRPFIMTIIQSNTEKQRPAILRNSSHLKKKMNNSNDSNPVDQLSEATADDNTSSDGVSPVETNKPVDVNLILSETQPSKLQVEAADFNETGWTSPNETFSENCSEEQNHGNDTESQDLNKTENSFTKGVDNSYEVRLSLKTKNIPFIVNQKNKTQQAEASISGCSSLNKNQIMSVQNKVVKCNEVNDKIPPNDKTFKVTSVEQKLASKETNQRFIKVVPYEPEKLNGKMSDSIQNGLDEDSEKNSSRDEKGSHFLSLSALSSVLKEILPDKWALILDKKYGLQVIKTQLDDLLNPSILISVVIARCGKLTVNVRGKQLKKSHELFSDLGEIKTSENKLSLHYVLAILHKLKYLSVCYGCDDPSLKKYWCSDGFIEYQTECQQVYRSLSCQLLVTLGKKRCYPCYRMNESLKTRYRRDKMGGKSKEETNKDSNTVQVVEEVEEPIKNNKEFQTKGVKRNLEAFLDESFSTMKQQIDDEIEKSRKLGEQESALKEQEEVLSLMGLARKDTLENSVRKSKRKKNTFFKLQQPPKKKVNQQELEFLRKYWVNINTLFSTSLLFGAYSRTSRGRLREKCRMFQKLLSTWKDIVKSNPEWIGGDINIPDEIIDGPPESESSPDQFDEMEVPALRAYIINSVKEVNRIKYKLKTRNSYFKMLYNKFVKRRMKKAKPLSNNSDKIETASSDKIETANSDKAETASSTNSTTNTPTPTDFSSDENSRDKEKNTENENFPENENMVIGTPEKN